MTGCYCERMEYNKKLLMKRRHTVRKQKIYLCMTLIVLTLIFTMMIGARFTFAKSTQDIPERIKVYRSIVINGGDTLTSITAQYCSSEWKDSSAYIHEVLRINNLNEDDMLIAGNYLIVPYYIEDPAGNL